MTYPDEGKMTNKKSVAHHEAGQAFTPAVVKVGDGGRGFVVETERGDRLVITAAHCLPVLPPPHPWSHIPERTYGSLLGPLGKTKPAVYAECLFADPLADIAVLISPDNQELGDEAAAYDELMESVARPFPVADAPQEGVERIELPGGGPFGGIIEVPTPGRGDALLLTLDGKWIKYAVERRGMWLSIKDEKRVKRGMSGSPIVSMNGRAIGLVSSASLNPVLLEALPPRIRLRKDQG
jgi:hypothetical protein